jgi:hypothetical protein
MSMTDVFDMTAHLGGVGFPRALAKCSVDGLAVVRVADMLRLLTTHGVSWEKVARRHSAQTAMRLAFNEVPIPSYATGKRRELEIEQCSVGM